MHYFRYVSLLIYLSVLFLSCQQKAYRYKKEVTGTDIVSAEILRPMFQRELYRATIDGKFGFKKFHLSGLLYLRTIDKNTRVVFQNEMGSTFFDFGWDEQDSFSVYQILPDLDKQALITTLRKDFELLLLKNTAKSSSGIYIIDGNKEEQYIRFERPKGFAYYVIPPGSFDIKRIEHGDEKRKVVELIMTPPTEGHNLANRISIKHLRAGFTIDLEKIENDVTE